MLKVHGAELKTGLREVFGHVDQHNLPYPEVGITDIPQTRLGPEVIDREEKDDVIGHFHSMAEEIADLAPGRIGHNPVHRLVPIEEVAAAFYFRPMDGSSAEHGATSFERRLDANF